MAAGSDDVDELEALLDSYTADAEKQIRRLEARASRYVKPRKEKAVREAGLCQPLDEGNKGYILLQKMGYESGKGLGSASTGRAEPLPLDLKTGRAGLGVDEQRKRERQQRQQQEELDRLKRARMTSEAQQRFQDTARADYLARQVARHLRGAWRAAEQLDQQLAAHGTCYGVTGDGALKDGALKDGALKDGALKDGALKDGPQGNGALTAESSAFSQYLINTDEQYGTTARSQPPGTGRSEVLQALLARLPAVRVMLAEEVLPEKVPAKELDGGSVLGEQVEEGREDVDGEGQREDEGAGAHHGPEHPQSARGCAATGAAAEGASSRDTCGGESSENGRDGVGVVGQGAPAAARGGPYVRVLVEEEEEEEQEAVRVEGCGSGMERGGHGDARRRVCEGGITSSKATEPSLSEQLEVLLQHLRERHWYCYFCGCQYDNPDDLAASCPGLNEDVH